MKKNSYKRKDYENDVSKIQREAILLEKLSHSPRVLDIYAHCGTSVLVEAMASDLYTKAVFDKGEGVVSQADLTKVEARVNDVYPLNNFTASEKLQISLEMAKSLADLHGFEGGPIVHADANIEQWLIALDGSIKLNDFNNGRPPRWNAAKQEYCLSHSSFSSGFERSPEEFGGAASDEGVDVFALGSTIYPLVR